MNYFEDWYPEPNDVNEQDQEKLLASMLAAAAADIPTGRLRNIPELRPSFSHDPSDFINRMIGTDLIQQLVNGHPADINLELGEQRDLPTRDQSVYDFLRKPAEPLDDLDFFDRNAPANLFPNTAGSSPDDDFWGGLQRGSGEVAEMPKINLAASDLANWLGSDKNPNAAELNNPANQGGTQTPDLSFRPEDYADLRKQWEAERLKNLATDKALNDLFKEKPFDEWIKEKVKPIIDLLPRKADGSPDWYIDPKVMTADQIAEEKAKRAQEPSNRNKEWDMTVKHLGNFRGQDYYFVYKYDLKTPEIPILRW
jgi:hypothetical protein